MRLLSAIFVATFALSCATKPSAEEVLPDGRVPLVFVLQPLGGEPKAFDALLDEFRAAHPDVALSTQLLPNNSDVAHQYFVTALEGRSRQFDVLVTDVVWTPEFAQAGWVADLSAEFPAQNLRKEFLPGPVDAVLLGDKTFAVPWYVDVGLLYYRKDLVARAPTTYAELSAFAAEARKADPSLRGYVFQGRQYEGLVCNVYEHIWGFGGVALSEGRLALKTPETVKALSQMRRFLQEGTSPSAVTSAAEEESRAPFQAGRAVFMRNWPYAWLEANKEGSPIRGKVGIAALPTESGAPGNGALGGWQLAVNAHSVGRRREAAVALVRHLTSEKAQEVMAISFGRNPSRRAVYESPTLAKAAPFIVELLPHFERAKPRPVTPYYGMLSDVLQSEFSAALSGVRSPEEALGRAQKRADYLMEVPR